MWKGAVQRFWLRPPKVLCCFLGLRPAGLNRGRAWRQNRFKGKLRFPLMYPFLKKEGPKTVRSEVEKAHERDQRSEAVLVFAAEMYRGKLVAVETRSIN